MMGNGASGFIVSGLRLFTKVLIVEKRDCLWHAVYIVVGAAVLLGLVVLLT